MPISIDIQASSLFAKLEGMSGKVRERFAASMKRTEESILSQARSNAVAHFHSVGNKPGVYLSAFSGGVKETPGSITGWVRNGARLAHLMENGFTISDLMIQADSGAMAFFEANSAAEPYRRNVHRHATDVQAFPAIGPAFEAHRAEIEAAARAALQNL